MGNKFHRVVRTIYILFFVWKLCDSAVPTWKDNKSRVKGDLPEGFSSPAFYQLPCIDADNDPITFTGNWDTSEGPNYFTFDTTTGILGVKSGARFDLDTLPQTVFILTAYGNDGTSNTAVPITVTLTIIASDPPDILQNDLSFTVDEGANGKALIPAGGLSNSSYTTDSAGDALTFAILPGSANVDYFTIDANTGMISYAKDYYIDGASPLPSTVSMVVEVTDEFGEKDTANVHFTILDVNQKPQFTNLPTSTSVAEDLSPGSSVFTVTATDKDSADTVTYSATFGTGADIFSVDPTSGEVTLQAGKSLDYETQKSFTITVTADDTKDTSTAVLTIKVTDVNEAPSFDQAVYTVTENEGLAAATLTNTGFGSSTSDPESDTLTYRITGGTYANKFTMNSNTGAFTYASDYEVDASSPLPTNVVLDIEVADPGGLTGTAKLDITIQNVNKAPTLDNLPTTVSIPEDSTSGTSVFTVTFSDPDTGDTLTLKSTSKTSGGTANFIIDANTGEVKVKSSASLDYNSQSQYIFSFEVSDGTLKSTTKDLTINLISVNKPPTFSFTTFSVTVPEGKAGYTFPDPGIKAKATDPDGDAITFSIVTGTHSDKFAIDPNTAVVSYAQDYEVDPTALPNNVVLTIQAADPDGLTVTTTLDVTITDVNKDPVLDNLDATTSVAEDLTGGSTIYTVKMSDPDTLDTPTLEYSFVDTSSAALFDINKSTGVVSLKPGATLDYETKTLHRINFVATDSKSNSTQRNLRIQVTNINEAPKFNSASFAVTGDEGLTGKSFPDAGLKSGSTDPESDSLTYTIIGGDPNNRFSLDPNSGILSFAKDYEVDALALPGFASLMVQVKDPSGLTDTAKLDVTINNVNKAPVIDNLPTSVDVDEDLLGGTPIFSVASTDPDSGDTVTFQYTITPTTGTNLFDIDTNSGAISLKPTASLDYETENSYSVSFTAADGTKTSSPKILTINVNNVNEAPTFSGTTFKVTVDEGPAGTTFPDAGIATATSDPESDTLTYSIISGANRDKFTMDPNTGIVSFASDYDVDRANADQPGSVFLIVEVTDPSGLKDTSTLDITINNINKAPNITNLPTTISVPEDTLAGSTIYTVDCRDSDTGDLTTLQYSFISGDPSLFDTNVNIGLISLKPGAKLDYESNRFFIVRVECSDGTLSSGSQDLQIVVTNVNEAPLFSRPTYAVTVPEGPTGSIVVPYLTSSVTDEDSPDTRTFSIIPGSNADKFNIDSSTGRITYASDYDTDPNGLPNKVTLTVQAEDAGGLRDTSVVDVTITNINKPPTITNLYQRITIPEDQAAGSSIFDVTTTDPDSADIVTTYHTFLDTKSSGVFNIDTKGRVTLKPSAKLDYETDSYYRIRFEASDSVLNSTSEDLEIIISNVNEAPSFTTAFTTTVNEGSKGTAIPDPGIRPYSTDPERDTLTFDIVPGPNSNYFSMDPTSAALTFAQDYDADPSRLPGFVKLTVRATDPDGVTGTETLNITILNVNQPPTILNLDKTINVPENLPGGTTVFTVDVSDPDTADTTTLLPTFPAPAADSVFDVNTQTGAISIKSPSQLDYETTQQYTIEFTVTDSQLTSSTTVTLTLDITNTNEVPKFSSPVYTATLPEGPAGSVVYSNLVNSVTDLDTGDVQTFSIKPGPNSDYFNIDSTSGNISFSQYYDVDPVKQPGSVSLTILSTDLFSLVGETRVDVTITNVNQPPTITNLPKTVSIPAGSGSGTDVYTVTASDPDSGDVITFRYQFPLRSTQDQFDIDPSTGAVTVKEGATFVYGSNPLKILVSVSDGTVESNVTTLTIEIGEAVEEAAFLEKSENLAWFIPLMILLGLALLALLGWLLYTCCCKNGGYTGKRRIFDSESPNRLVRKRPPTPDLPPETKFEPKMNVKLSDRIQFPRIYKYVPN